MDQSGSIVNFLADYLTNRAFWLVLSFQNRMAHRVKHTRCRPLSVIVLHISVIHFIFFLTCHLNLNWSLWHNADLVSELTWIWLNTDTAMRDVVQFFVCQQSYQIYLSHQIQVDLAIFKTILIKEKDSIL